MWNARLTISGERDASSISRHLCDLAKHLASVDFLESLAATHRPADLPDEGIIGVESFRATWSPPDALVVPGPRVTMTMPDGR